MYMYIYMQMENEGFDLEAYIIYVLSMKGLLLPVGLPIFLRQQLILVTQRSA